MTHRIETERLLLRTLYPDDLDRFFTLINERDVAASTFSIPHPMKLETARIWVDYYVDPSQHGNDQHWAICTKTDGALIGMINVYNIDACKTRAEIGFWIGKNFWACGYCSEAAKAVVASVTDRLGLRSLFANYQSGNRASARILEKCGFVPFRTVRMYNRKSHRWEKVIQVLYDPKIRSFEES